MRAMLAAIRCGKGDVDGNLATHLRLVRSAGCDLVLFPEMSLTGSVDPASRPDRLVGLDHPAIATLAEATGGTGVAVCFGVAERSPGGDPYITQVVAAGGRVVGVQRKRHLGPGEEPFSAASASRTFAHAGVRFGIAICAEGGHDGPFDAAHAGGAGLVLFPAAPGLYGRRTDEGSWRAGHSWWEGCALGDARRHARRLGLWVALAGQAGSTEDEDFPGLAALVTPDGEVAERLPDWREGVLTVEIPPVVSHAAGTVAG
ncbi:carbon-nitrogen hydrolase family protein [Virgisporangium ochraceum]|uniref:Carbon-nitrogen hydrolase family protein n=1 Tax=Virgisporangium ochraceum TaxID=65505 RepID=A0A8J3ZTB2_9ACTN|nr:carbon-nitrogen hydrolase family protein [Virgisporangium ochraceum]GIJ68010.1 carbon-nitrogen hydrolase family protein [Virgisporangium ochraceum]